MIRSPSDGLLGSDITWNNVQEVINQSDHKFQLHDCTIKPLGVGVGLQSLLGIVEGNWDGDVPHCFVLKIGSPLALIDALQKQSSKLPSDLCNQMIDGFMQFLPKCHNAEIFFYESFNKLKKNEIEQIPQYYFGSKVSEKMKACMGIEYVGNVKTLTPADSINDFQMKQVLRLMAKVQATFLQIPEEQMNLSPHSGMADVYKTFPDWFVRITNQLMGQFGGEAVKPLVNKLDLILDDIVTAKQIDEFPEKLGFRRVFVHGDLWPANLLFKDDDKLEKLIDFQMMHFGLPATDLSRLFNSALNRDERRKMWKSYLKYFYTCLTEEIGENQNLPYTYEQLELSYRLSHPRTSSYLLMALIPAMEIFTNDQERLLKLLSKIVGIYEDVIEMHEINSSVQLKPPVSTI